jgi:hypothetical protein
LKRKYGNHISDVVVCPKCRNRFASLRQGAYLVDALLFNLLVYGVIYVLISASLYMRSAVAFRPIPSLWFGSPEFALSYLLFPFLFTLKDGFSGKTPGRLLCGLTVIDSTTREPIGFKQSCKRNAILMVPYVGVAVIMLSMMNGRRYGDRWANTTVVWDKHVYKRPFDPRGIRCHGCGYDLTGNVSGVCPECGKPINQPPAKSRGGPIEALDPE